MRQISPPWQPCGCPSSLTCPSWVEAVLRPDEAQLLSTTISGFLWNRRGSHRPPPKLAQILRTLTMTPHPRPLPEEQSSQE